MNFELSHSLVGPKLKVRHAEELVKKLGEEIKNYVNANPVHLIKEDDHKSGKSFWRVYGLRTLPSHWSCLVGDCIHNLRSALDILVCDLIREAGNEPDDWSAFPINQNNKSMKKRLNGVSKRAQRLIYALKPYKGGNELLWTLHRLDILDKHQLLIPVAVGHANVQMKLQLPPVGTATPPPVWVTIPAQRDAVKDGDIVFGAPPDGEEYEIRCAFQVLFGDLDVAARAGIIPTLNDIGKFIDRIIKVFDRRIFKVPQ